MPGNQGQAHQMSNEYSADSANIAYMQQQRQQSQEQLGHSPSSNVPPQNLIAGQHIYADPNSPAFAAPRVPTSNVMNMSTLAGALPNVQPRDAQQYQAAQYGQSAYPGQVPGYQMHPSQYMQPYPGGPMQNPNYPQVASHRGFSGAPAPVAGASYYPAHQQQQYAFAQGHGASRGMPHAQGAYGRGSGPYGGDATNPGYYGDYGGGHARQSTRSDGSPNKRSGNPGGSIPSTPRGPPRKPKQSGHALWVGNLPSGAKVSDLKDHFSRDATKDIESVFLISKSNCAFVNYRTEAACTAAMSRFHDARFQGVRLVCRLRRSAAATTSSSSSTPVLGAPSGPAAFTQHPQASPNKSEVPAAVRPEKQTEEKPHDEPTVRVPNKYFIMKSLTVEDMELSVRNNIWATQAHNEDALNQAYESADNVYLIFSANKSGEYFGFARMASPINDEVSADLDWTPNTSGASGGVVNEDPEIVPRSIATPATEYAPRGRIIDDSARGTIFWEAEHDDDTGEDEVEPTGEPQPSTTTDQAEAAEGGEAGGFGTPFKVEWLSTARLPFYRTRGLRNPWNVNREVKIARDGTELETNVGRRLLGMFGSGGSVDQSYPMGYPTETPPPQ